MAKKMDAGYAKNGCNVSGISINNFHERDTHFNSNRPCLTLNAQRFSIIPEYIFACSSCDETFNAEGDLVIHQRVHDGESPFKCDLCDMKFKSKGEFVSHEIHHMAEQKEVTVKSPKSQSSKHKKDMIKCAFCKKLFHKNKRKDLTVHVMNTHSDKLWKETKSKKYDCNECNEVYIKKGDLKLHMKTHLKDRKKPICKKIGMEISSSAANHECSFETNLYCKPCDKTFFNKAALVLHRRMHLKRPFTCVKCKHSFSQDALMKKHVCNSVLAEIATDIEKDVAERQNIKATSDDDSLLIIEKDIHDNTSEEDVDDPLSVSEVDRGEANASNRLVTDEEENKEMQNSPIKKNVGNKPHILIKDITTLTIRKEIDNHSSRPLDNIMSGSDSKIELNNSIFDEHKIVEIQNMETKKNSKNDPLNKSHFNTLVNTAEETIDDPLEISDIEMDDSVNKTTEDKTVSLDRSERMKSFDYSKGIKEFQSSFGNINDDHGEVVNDTMVSNYLERQYDSIYKGFVVLKPPVFFNTSDLVYTS